LFIKQQDFCKKNKFQKKQKIYIVIYRDDQQTKFYTDGVKEAIELHGTPSCQRKLTSVRYFDVSEVSTIFE
jgi:hypothetical protein